MKDKPKDSKPDQPSRLIEVRGETTNLINLRKTETWRLTLENEYFTIEVEARKRNGNDELEKMKQLRALCDEVLHRYKFRKEG